jgi:hypothetical protein
MLHNGDVDTALVREIAVFVVLRAFVAVRSVAAEVLALLGSLELGSCYALGSFFCFGRVFCSKYAGDQPTTSCVEVKVR